MVNEAQQRLVFAGGEVGWWGSWAKMAFTVDSVANPYITLPREVARIINLDICKQPVRIQNEFYEFLEAGIGLQPKGGCSLCNGMETFDRGEFPTFLDLAPPNKRLRYYITDAADVNKRVLTQGTDQNGSVLRSVDASIPVQGVFSTLKSPFVDTAMDIGSISGIQKDVTTGSVLIYEVDTITAAQRLILTMEPSELVSGYRRYYLGGLPQNCCQDGTNNVQVTAMAKLEFIPVMADTDYCIIQNIAALKEECLAVRAGEMDDSASVVQSQARHLKALKLLNGELNHHLGKDRVAVGFKPFGSAHLGNQKIGALT